MKNKYLEYVSIYKRFLIKNLQIGEYTLKHKNKMAKYNMRPVHDVGVITHKLGN